MGGFLRRFRRLRYAWQLTAVPPGQLIDATPYTYREDGLITFHNSDFRNDPIFREAYRLGKETGSWGDLDLEWRVYVACWAARSRLGLGGDLVECGVNRGGVSRAVMHYLSFQEQTDRRFYLIDTYCGFPENQRHLAVQRHLDEYATDCYPEVVQTFSGFSNAVIVRGAVPDVLPQVNPEKVCYLSIDMNCAEPEVAAAEYFWGRMVRGGVVVLDDYGYSSDYLRQKIALDVWARSRGVEILTLPTGQGLIFKP